MASKWSKAYFEDLAERVGATAIGALLGVLTGTGTGVIPNDPAVWWALLGVPTATSLLKGLLANMANPETGASALPPAPPAEDGAVDPGSAALGALVAAVVVYLIMR